MRFGKKAPKPPQVSGLPNELTVDEDTNTSIDMSEVKIKNFGSKNEIVTIKLKVSEGVLEAVSGNKVAVAGSGTNTLEMTGKLKDIAKFFKQEADVSYTGAQDDFGENAAALTMSISNAASTFVVGEVNVNITDISDDQIGTPQDDTLTGDEGRNTLNGLGANDLLSGLGGDDSILGEAGDDTILGGAGADTLDGGAGADVLQYVGSSAGVTVNLFADGAGFQQATGGDAAGDVISGFEHIYASDHDDILIGNDERNILFGYGGDDSIQGNGGDDVIRGDEGADTLEGGDGSDWLRYTDSALGVTIDLNADGAGFQQASGGDASGDVISGFENVQGSEAGDTITGDAGTNYILGFGGDDNIDGGAGRDTIRGGEGADTLNGGADTDLLQYAGSSSGVTVDLNADGAGFQQASGGDATGDVISGFENVYATNHDDKLTGNEERNILYGYAGNDTLDGGDGKDVLRGGSGQDEFIFSSAQIAGNEDRIIDFEANVDTIQLDSTVFVGLTAGALDAGAFHVNTTGLAEDAGHRVIYESDSGNLYFDVDGVGGVDGILFATLSSTPSIDEADIFIF